jgi:hypothetical protein
VIKVVSLERQRQKKLFLSASFNLSQVLALKAALLKSAYFLVYQYL